MLYNDQSRHFHNGWIRQINHIQVILYFFDIMKEQMASYLILRQEILHEYQVFNRCSSLHICCDFI